MEIFTIECKQICKERMHDVDENSKRNNNCKIIIK